MKGAILGPLMQVGLPLLKSVLTLLAKSVLMPLGLMTALLATDAAIHEQIFGLGINKLIISKKDMKDITKDITKEI